jgi:hypothetical protein
MENAAQLASDFAHRVETRRDLRASATLAASRRRLDSAAIMENRGKILSDDAPVDPHVNLLCIAAQFVISGAVSRGSAGV